MAAAAALPPALRSRFLELMAVHLRSIHYPRDAESRTRYGWRYWRSIATSAILRHDQGRRCKSRVCAPDCEDGASVCDTAISGNINRPQTFDRHTTGFAGTRWCQNF
jgi:hypothetical protein